MSPSQGAEACPRVVQQPNADARPVCAARPKRDRTGSATSRNSRLSVGGRIACLPARESLDFAYDPFQFVYKRRPT